jgi:hypothetical protein
VEIKLSNIANFQAFLKKAEESASNAHTDNDRRLMLIVLHRTFQKQLNRLDYVQLIDSLGLLLKLLKNWKYQSLANIIYKENAQAIRKLLEDEICRKNPVNGFS